MIIILVVCLDNNISFLILLKCNKIARQIIDSIIKTGKIGTSSIEIDLLAIDHICYLLLNLIKNEKLLSKKMCPPKQLLNSFEGIS